MKGHNSDRSICFMSSHKVRAMFNDEERFNKEVDVFNNTLFYKSKDNSQTLVGPGSYFDAALEEKR